MRKSTARKPYKCRHCKVTYMAKPGHTECPICKHKRGQSNEK